MYNSQLKGERLKILFYLFYLILSTGCSEIIPKKEAEAEVAIASKVFKESSQNGAYKKAIQAIHKIIKLNNQADLELYEADMYYYLAGLYFQDKNYLQSILYYKKSAIEYKREPNREGEYYLAISWLGRLYMMQERYDESLTYHKKALLFLENHTVEDKNFQLSNAYGNIAILYQNMAQYGKALMANKKSLKLLLKFYPEKIFAIATNYNNISAIKNTTGDYPLALEYLKKSIDLYIQKFGKENPVLSSSYNNLAVHYIKIGNNKKALFYLHRALEVKNNQDKDKDLANIYNTLGGAYLELKRYDKSFYYHQKAIALYRELKKDNSVDIASAYLNLGKYYEENNNFDNAMNYYKKAEKIDKELLGEANLITAETYESIGLMYMAKNKNSEALSYLNRVLQIRKKILGEENELTKQIYKSIGGVLYNQKKYHASYLNIKNSFNFFMKKRERFFSVLNSEDKKRYIEENSEQIQLLLESASELGDEKIVEVTVNDWLNYKGTLFDRENAMDRIYLSSERKIREKIEILSTKKRKLAKYYQQKSTPLENKVFDQKIEILERDISALEIAFEPQIKEVLRGISSKVIAKNLKENELYIDYAKVGRRYFVFTIDSDHTLTLKRHSMESSKKITGLVLAFKNAMRKRRDTKKILVELYIILMKNINLEKTSFLISSDGALRLLPFEALYNNKRERYLIEDHEIRYIPSGKELVRLFRKKEKVSKDEIVIFSNPDFDTNIKATHRGVRNDAIFSMKFNKLPQTKKEAEEIKNIFQDKNIIEYQGKEASEENLFQIKQPKILHIATHGFFLNSNLSNPMLKSGIALSGANRSLLEGRDDGIVTALKLSGLKLKNTELVVLSACKTGVIDIRATESISGLSKAFIQAGADHIIASLWSVSDEGTKDLMRLFYKEIAQGKSYTQALKEAKLKMIKSDTTPFVWASFIINGI